MGGRLWVHESGYHDARNKLQRFNGNMPHMTEYFSGERYSIVYYVHKSFPRCDEEDRAFLSGLGFRFPDAAWYAKAATKAYSLASREVRLERAQKYLIEQQGIYPVTLDVVDYSSDDPIDVLDSSEDSDSDEGEGVTLLELQKEARQNAQELLRTKPNYDDIIASMNSCLKDEVALASQTPDTNATVVSKVHCFVMCSGLRLIFLLFFPRSYRYPKNFC